MKKVHCSKCYTGQVHRDGEGACGQSPQVGKVFGLYNDVCVFKRMAWIITWAQRGVAMSQALPRLSFRSFVIEI